MLGEIAASLTSKTNAQKGSITSEPKVDRTEQVVDAYRVGVLCNQCDLNLLCCSSTSGILQQL